MVTETYVPLFHEILEQVHKAKTKDEKVAILKRYNSAGLRWFLRAAFDPDVEWLLPKGSVPFIANDAPDGTEHTRLHREYRALDNFISLLGVIAKPALSQTRRETLFIQLVEGLSAGEADLLVQAKDRKLSRVYKGLSIPVCKEAFNWNDNFMLST